MSSSSVPTSTRSRTSGKQCETRERGSRYIAESLAPPLLETHIPLLFMTTPTCGLQGTNMSGYTLYLQDNFAASLDAHGGGRENVPVRGRGGGVLWEGEGCVQWEGQGCVS